MTVEDVLRRLQGVKRGGNGWVARCPAHDDRHASLGVTAGDDGRVLLKCHAECDTRRIVAALGIQLGDLFPERPSGREPDAVYDYFDERGELLYQVIRFPGKQFRQRRPEGTGWSWKLGDVRRVLYRLPEVLASEPDESVVYVVEGEKDANALVALGFVATSNAGGAGKWRREYSESLRGREVVILPDNDEPGRAHAAAAAKSLHGVALRVRVVQLPGLPEKGDVSDWLGSGHGAAELQRLVSEAPEWTPGGVQQEAATVASSPAGFVRSADRAAGLPGRVRERAKTSRPFHVGFLDDIAIGLLETDLVVLGAPTGKGKTTLAAIFAQNAAKSGSRVHYFALEAHDGEIEQRMLFRIMSRRLWERFRDTWGHVDERTIGFDPDAKARAVAEVQTFTYGHWCHGRCEGAVRHVERDAMAELQEATRNL